MMRFDDEEFSDEVDDYEHEASMAGALDDMRRRRGRIIAPNRGASSIQRERNAICVRCGAYCKNSLRLGWKACKGCMDAMRKHHEQFEDIWDIDAEDMEALSNPEIQEEIVFMNKWVRGGLAALDMYGISIESLKHFLKRHRVRLSNGVPTAVAMDLKARNRVKRGEKPSWVGRIEMRDRTRNV